MSYPLNQYDKFVQEMWMNGKDPHDTELAIATLGLTGESGEVAEKVKKLLRGDPVDPAEFKRTLARELGDVLFYVTKLAHLHGMRLNDIAEINVEKLYARKARNGTLRGDGDDR